jgi:hypothetical protein
MSQGNQRELRDDVLDQENVRMIVLDEENLHRHGGILRVSNLRRKAGKTTNVVAIRRRCRIRGA